MRTISREVAPVRELEPGLTPQRLHAELLTVSASSSRAYLLGALHDATLSPRHRTVRFGQCDRRWLELLGILLEKLDQRWWIYREGKTRMFWILETSTRFLGDRCRQDAEREPLAYARGYFDAEGGVPREPTSRFYIQFVQKDQADIEDLRSKLEISGIRCGKVHNPSVRNDPDLWRFYVLAGSHRAFVDRVSSWHPRKRHLLDQWSSGRMKI